MSKFLWQCMSLTEKNLNFIFFHFPYFRVLPEGDDHRGLVGGRSRVGKTIVRRYTRFLCLNFPENDINWSPPFLPQNLCVPKGFVSKIINWQWTFDTGSPQELCVCLPSEAACIDVERIPKLQSLSRWTSVLPRKQLTTLILTQHSHKLWHLQQEVCTGISFLIRIRYHPLNPNMDNLNSWIENSKFHGNHTPISHVLICLLN